MQNFIKSILSLILIFCAAQIFSQNDDFRFKLSSNLADKLDMLSHNKVTIHILLEKQLDYSQWNNEMKASRRTLLEEKQLLLQSLRANARQSQGPLLQFLKEINADGIHPHWIANSITCTVLEKNIAAIARRSDVKWVGLQANLKPTQEDIAPLPMPMAPNKSERGLIAINAHKMWELGYTGYGGVVLTADTGVDPTHPAISSHYKGAIDDPKGTWFSFQGGEARDCGYHGTHVTGTILGLDRLTKDTIGVAFNARWIGAGILCGIGTEDNIGAFEWALNPDNDTTTVEDIPHVINNSWYDPSLNGLDCNSIYVPILEALEAAGVAVIFSAGNEGPDPNTITQPHNINIHELNAFTVGALNGNNSNLPIASFSSRGPSHCPGEGPIKIKPEVSAPGVNVRSCVRDGEYGQLSGTSMASPHTSGAVLLLREAFPYLKGYDFKEALYNSCTDLGDTGEDNVFGQGIINVYAAYEYLKSKGHQPVEPITSNDIRLLDVKHSVAGCDGKIYPTILMENASQDTIKSFELFISGVNPAVSTVWNGLILPNQIQAINIDPVSLPEGNYKLKLTLQNPNGQIDNRNLDNSKLLNVVVSPRKPLLEKVILNDTTLCDGGSIFLDLPSHPEFKTKTVFYNQLHAGDILPINEKLALKSGKILAYAEVSYTDIVGPSPEVNSNVSEANNRGIIFNTKLPIQIDSMQFSTTQTGVRRFMAFNSFGDTLYDLKTFIKAGTFNKKFNWKFAPGEGYRIVKVEGLPLAISEVPSYPILDKQGVMTIVGETEAGTQYPYFYNIQISIPEACGRIPYEINVSEKKAVGKADFEASKYELYVPNDAEIVLTNRSDLFVSSSWNMGDGTEYNTENVTHTFKSKKNYLISLTIVDTAGCVNATGRVINVYQSTTSAQDLIAENHLWDLAPNPAQDIFHLTYHGDDSGDGLISIHDLQGKVLETSTISLSKENSNSINTSLWLRGTYVVRVVYKNKVYQTLLVKL